MSVQLIEKISQYWRNIQGNLLPWLGEQLGPLNEKQQQLVATLEFLRIEEFVQYYLGINCIGRPLEDRTAIARAFVAKAIYNLSTTRQLLDRLESDVKLRRICGWERADQIPGEWTFSRAFSEFANAELTQRVHEVLVKEYQSERLVGHNNRDSTAIEAREKAFKKDRSKKKEKPNPKEPTRVERQVNMTSAAQMLAEIPKRCDIGTKKDSNGNTYSWKGYKLHIDTVDGGIPISAVLTSASVHDSQVAIPLMKMSSDRVTNCYDLMDAAYDSGVIRLYSFGLGHVPLIDFNRRSKKDTRSFMPHEKQRYKHRSAAERTNARLKDEFGGLYVRVRGHAKVMTHLMFGMLALTVDQLLRFLTPEPAS